MYSLLLNILIEVMLTFNEWVTESKYFMKLHEQLILFETQLFFHHFNNGFNLFNQYKNKSEKKTNFLNNFYLLN